MDCSVQSLATNSNKIECCIQGRPQINAVKVWLLATLLGVSTDPTFLRAQAKCLSNCDSALTLLGFDVYLATLLASSSQDSNILMNNARCFAQPCIYGSLRAAMQIWILTQITGTTTDPQTLVNNAKCILECIPEGELFAVETWLLTQLAGNTSDPTSLAASAKCLNCLNADELDAIYTYLLCQRANLVANQTLLIGLYAYYTLNETTGNRLDSTANHFDLTDNGVLSVTGKLSNGIQGVPNGGNLTGPAAGQFDFVNAPFTVTAWIKLADKLADRSLVSCARVQLGFGWRMMYDFTLDRYVSEIINGSRIASSHVPTVGTYEFVVMWYDGTTLFCQVNNEAIASIASAAASGSASAAFMVAGDFLLAKPFNGSVDEVSVWTRVLTQPERDLLYSSGAGKTYPFT